MAKRQTTQPAKKGFKITRSVENDTLPPPIHEPYKPLPGVVPDTEAGRNALAMDATPYELVNQIAGLGNNGAVFLGYPALATLAQTVEYYNMAQVMADEMVRNWITVRSHDKDSEVPAEIERLLLKYDIKRLFHEAVKQDSLFGVAHIYVDTTEDYEEIKDPLIMDPRAIPKGTKLSFRCVDPSWVYPAMYNTSEPLKKGFYKPTQWYVMGKVVHESRFIDIISRPVTDILKPSYNFGGLSLSQLMISYVNDWRAIKSDVIEIVKTLRMRVLKTDMDARTQDAGGFDTRIKLMVKHQDNFGVLALDTEEELVHIQTSLSDLSNLLSNYQEQLCIPARITNLKLLGNAPAGLNASGDAEIETWHETISGMQERDIRHALETIIALIQLAEFGAIDEDIFIEFNPLDEISEKEQTEIDLNKANILATLSDSQIISTEDAAQAAGELESVNLDNPKAPEPEDDEEWQNENA